MCLIKAYLPWNHSNAHYLLETLSSTRTLFSSFFCLFIFSYESMSKFHPLKTENLNHFPYYS